MLSSCSSFILSKFILKLSAGQLFLEKGLREKLVLTDNLFDLAFELLSCFPDALGVQMLNEPVI